MKRLISIRCVLTGLVPVLALEPPRAPGQYTYTTIDFPGAAETVVMGINNHGQIVGQYGNIDLVNPSKTGNGGFVLDGGTFQEICVPDSKYTNASGINDHGVIVGSYRTQDDHTRGFLWDGAGYHDIVTPFADGASVNGINNHGQLVGTYSNDDFELDQHGFLYDGVEFHSIDHPDANQTHVTGINDSGELVGYYRTDGASIGFLISGDVFKPISATSTTQVLGVNNEGQAVGVFVGLARPNDLSAVRSYPFIYDLDSEEFSYPGLPWPDCEVATGEFGSHCFSALWGINSHRDIVGFYDNDDGDFHGFVGTLPPMLQAGDADQNLQFDQLDLVNVLAAAKYLTGQPATWGEGDWDGAPGGTPGNPPSGDGVFDQTDIIWALAPAHYLTGPYARRFGMANNLAASAVRAMGIAAGGDEPGGRELIGMPEPASALLLGVGLLIGVVSIRIR
jgi:probable HAF family extracellular repeat protein